MIGPEGLVFVDTNILVYHRDTGHPDKQAVSARWLTDLWRTRRGCLSFQVLQEYYAVVTRKLRPGLPPAVARRDIRHLLLWHPVVIDAGVLETAFDVMDRYGLSWWDAQIVAAARRAGCVAILSEDMHDGLDVEGMVIRNPFVATD